MGTYSRVLDDKWNIDFVTECVCSPHIVWTFDLDLYPAVRHYRAVQKYKGLT